jgi:hypothetical protein
VFGPISFGVAGRLRVEVKATLNVAVKATLNNEVKARVWVSFARDALVYPYLFYPQFPSLFILTHTKVRFNRSDRFWLLTLV